MSSPRSPWRCWVPVRPALCCRRVRRARPPTASPAPGRRVPANRAAARPREIGTGPCLTWTVQGRGRAQAGAGNATSAADEDRHVMTTNRTHRARLARALAAVADIGYQTALARVITAAEAGTLPQRLDEAGMRQALDTLLAATTTAPAGQAG